MDKNLMSGIEQVETSCNWFLKTFEHETDKDRLSGGILKIARALRTLMIMVEQENPSTGMLEILLYEHPHKCERHNHLELLTFTSKGEFKVKRLRQIGGLPVGILEEAPRPFTPVELISKFDMPATSIVHGVQRAIHALVLGKMTTMPPAQA
jgi:hypothetical protein